MEASAWTKESTSQTSVAQKKQTIRRHLHTFTCRSQQHNAYCTESKGTKKLNQPQLTAINPNHLRPAPVMNFEILQVLEICQAKPPPSQQEHEFHLPMSMWCSLWSKQGLSWWYRHRPPNVQPTLWWLWWWLSLWFQLRLAKEWLSLDWNSCRQRSLLCLTLLRSRLLLLFQKDIML